MTNNLLLENVLTIYSSYQIHSPFKMMREIEEIKRDNPSSPIWRLRNKYSLVNEWFTHNICYYLHIARNHTADVDFEFPQKWYFTFAFNIIGIIITPTLFVSLKKTMLF